MDSRQRGRRAAKLLGASILCAALSTATCGTTMLLTPAQDRAGGGGGGGIWDTIFNPFGGTPSTPAYNVPDVAGFGMYPLWKFHKFDGLSLRPVPYGVDIGTGLPTPPHPPNYPTGFLPAYNQATPAAPQPNYAPPANPPATNYEPAPASSPSYKSPEAAPSYGSAPPPNHQVLNYQLSGTQYPPAAPPPQEPAAPPPAPPSYGNAQPPLSISYSPAGPSQASYNAPPAAPAYAEQNSAPAYGGYGSPSQQAPPPPPPSYGGAPQGNPGYGNAPGGYDSGPYGAGSNNGITIQFQPAGQEYGMQQQPNYGSVPAGSYNMPTYTAIESPMSAYPQMQDSMRQLPMDQGYGAGGFLKRSHTSFLPEGDPSKNELEDNDFSSQ